MDSIRPEIKQKFLNLYFPPTPDERPEIIHDPDQESTDFTKAVIHITKTRPNLQIIVIGSLYGRVDQALSQLHHLFMFSPSGSQPLNQNLYLITDTSISWVLTANTKHVIECKSSKHRILGKYVGIIPLLGESRISTKGLQWDVDMWETRFGGRVSTSNRVGDGNEEGTVEVWGDRDVFFTVDMMGEGEVEWNVGG